MSMVILVSGGLDSTLVAKLAQEEGIDLFPLFINYGQRAHARELAACRNAMKVLGLPPPQIADLAGYGQLIRSGLTDHTQRILEDAFTPGRNMLFILTAAAYAYQIGADAVSIGLLNEASSIFPDQTTEFIQNSEKMIAMCMGKKIRLLTPLSAFHKRDVVALAIEKGIDNTYSCHLGTAEPCGACIAFNEFKF